jgi:hypothetical protein
MRSKKYTDEKIIETLPFATSLGDLAKKIGMEHYSANSVSRISRRIKELGLDISHFISPREASALPQRRAAAERMRLGVKRCIGCDEVFPLEEFIEVEKSLDGRGSRCEACRSDWWQDYYSKTKDTTNPKRAEVNARRRKEHQLFFAEYLLSHPCVDCGETDILLLDFDHINNDKSFNVTANMGGNLDKIRSEILKCEVRCLICHRVKTAKTFGSWRLEYSRFR